MSEEHTARRRLAVVLAGAALLLALGAPLHQHHLAASSDAPALEAQAPLDASSHAGSDCPACQSSGRTRPGLAPAGLVVPARALPGLRLDAPGALALPSAASPPPTPPRGPPSPTA
jgi:hypothetical protein